MAGRSTSSKLGIALASALVFPLLLELGLRVAGFEHPRFDPPLVIWNAIEDRELASSAGLHQADTLQLWKPRAGARIPYGGADHEEFVNDEGWRGPERPRKRAPGTLRVATLGDSSTFGLGVVYADTWSARLEAELAARGAKAEVLDFGVIGYTARQGLARWRALASEWRPDVVVAAFGAVNEHHAAKLGDDDEKLARNLAEDGLGKSLRRGLRDHLRIVHLASRLVDGARGGQQAVRMAWYERWRTGLEMEGTMGQSDWTGERRVTPERMASSLEELRREVEASGARLVVISMPREPAFERESPVLMNYTRSLVAWAMQAKVSLYDARGAFLEAGPAMLIPGDPVHPSPEGHELIARGLTPLVLAAEAAAASAPAAEAAPGAGGGR